jgi:hypothetical protein
MFPAEQLLPAGEDSRAAVRVIENRAAVRDARHRFEAEVNKNSRSGPLPEREMIG